MNEYKLFGQRIGLIGITRLLLSLSGMILLPVLTKNLPIEEYGAWVQIMATIGLIAPLAEMGLSYTMVRFLAAEKDKRKKPHNPRVTSEHGNTKYFHTKEEGFYS